MTDGDRTVQDGETPHRHWLVFHRHPDWHGHCDTRGPLPPDHPFADTQGKHSCRRWHFHLPFKHLHTETGR